MSRVAAKLKSLPAVAALTAVGAIAVLGGAPRAAAPPNDEKTIVHVLNRIGFGARPGDVERVQKIGLQKYIEQQLHPESIPDSGMAARLSDLKTVNLSSREIAEDYERPMLEARRDRKQEQARQDPREMTDRPRPAPNPVQQKANSVVVELAEQKLLRAVYSERQLQEVLTDFWFNHFNVDARKGRDRYLLTAYERDAIRPHVLGKFRDLLGATAKSPAMLFYLDNWMSADRTAIRRGLDRARFGRPGRLGRGRPFLMPQRPASRRKLRGLNENYGRS